MALLVSAILAYATDVGGQSQPAPGATPPPRPLQIDKNSVLILIRTTLVALQQANQTGNYNVLRGLTAPEFQKSNSAEKLAQSFANLRAKNFDLSGVVVLDPQLTVLPEIYSNGVMRFAGFFPSVPMQVLFEMQFFPVNGQWRLVALAVDVAGSAPAAPVNATPNPALASSYTPTPAPKSSHSPTPAKAASASPAASASTATASPSPTPSPTIPEVEVRTRKRAASTPKP
jgi:hypothetical protein